MTSKQFRPSLEILEQRDTPSAATLLPNGTLWVNGTGQADTILVSTIAGSPKEVSVEVTTNGVSSTQTFERADVKRLHIDGRAGNDIITNNTAIPAVIFGGKGDDTITGGYGRDIIFGGPGNDTIRGRGASDILLGGPGNDIISGGPGNDIIIGGKGRDIISGGTGHNHIIDGPGLHRRDHANDTEHDADFERIDTLISRLHESKHKHA